MPQVISRSYLWQFVQKINWHNLADNKIDKEPFCRKQDCILFEGTEEELDCELADGLRDLRRVKGRDLDVDRERRRLVGGLPALRYGAGE